MRRDLAEDAAWLTGLVAALMPDQPEVLGLLALMKLNLARSAARFDAAGEMVLLPDQDRSLWDRAAHRRGRSRCSSARARCRRPGPYQLQAAIAALHAEARSWDDTDWHQIVVLYDALVRMADSPVVRLNRAVALSHFAGPEVALGEMNDLALSLSGYHLFHSTRAELLDRLGEPALAREARLRALELCQNPAERSLLERKLEGLAPSLSGHPQLRGPAAHAPRPPRRLASGRRPGSGSRAPWFRSWGMSRPTRRGTPPRARASADRSGPRRRT